MARRRGKSRGWQHDKAVAGLKRRHRDGVDVCRRCGHPMWLAQGLDGGHDDRLPYHLAKQALPDALEHSHCNRSAGATYGNRLRGASRNALNLSRRW
jgi:hypothetical protein